MAWYIGNSSRVMRTGPHANRAASRTLLMVAAGALLYGGALFVHGRAFGPLPRADSIAERLLLGGLVTLAAIATILLAQGLARNALWARGTGIAVASGGLATATPLVTIAPAAALVLVGSLIVLADIAIERRPSGG